MTANNTVDGIYDGYRERREHLGLSERKPLPVVQDTREDWPAMLFAVVWSFICVAVGAFIGWAVRGWWGVV